MNFVKQPISVDISDGVSARGLDELPLGERKWPIHYDSVEPLAVVADLATITLASVISGFLYHLYGTGTLGDIGKSVGSAILVSALFISVMKIRGMYRPTELLILGSPKAGTPLLAATPTLAIDLPLKVLAWEDADGRVWLSYNAPVYLQERHGFPPELLKNIAPLGVLVEAVVASAS